MENGTKKNVQRFKKDIAEHLWKLTTELPLAFLLGTVPVLWFSSSEKDVEIILGGLLASGPLIKYAAYLTILYALIITAKYAIRFSFDSSRDKFRYTYEIISEVGSGFLTITRTGLGAMMGVVILHHTSELVPGTPKQVTAAYATMISFALINCAIALVKDRAIEHTERKPEKNPIRLSKNLK